MSVGERDASHVGFGVPGDGRVGLSAAGQWSISAACANVFQVKAIECGAETIVTVYGKHRMLPGDVVALEGIQSTDASARRV